MGESKRRKALDPNYGIKRNSRTPKAEEIGMPVFRAEFERLQNDSSYLHSKIEKILSRIPFPAKSVSFGCLETGETFEVSVPLKN